MITNNNIENALPWYKEYYVWLIILFPMLAVMAGIVTIVLAVQSDDGLVVDDYYKQGLEINRTLERDQTAIDYDLDAAIKIHQENEDVVITLSAASNFTYPSSLVVTFLNATRAGMDEVVNLVLTKENIYKGRLKALDTGKWYVHIQRDDWRLIKTVYID